MIVKKQFSEKELSDKTEEEIASLLVEGTNFSKTDSKNMRWKVWGAAPSPNQINVFARMDPSYQENWITLEEAANSLKVKKYPVIGIFMQRTSNENLVSNETN